ncbi:PTS-dependent dihydroxyacetone kinase phosphotransferase subunit DhaM [Arthrobacter sp. Sa2CUA1]|uniref:Phosphocarrier protein HPr n=2 Tax=Arthrobacter TaxID=1663 RepID=A0ABR8UQW6_9MICC|nr:MULTISPECIES: dihydroxyacetone kinase phosphoryl donor subunit DhaM [Arthrobacter]MBD7994962.1 PTS-dependent dihydroxyacetone kinase phosphotransferase subunit DhaM [Arthrobacter gallicola]MBD8042306.1 PTS-dependent dihydroxyacetone kinase phosphotransferase subunit DhaM [Arthrobacter pullicola]
MRVGLVIVSHSDKLAEGLCELAGQMAPDVALIAAGGTDDGGIGTSLEKIQAGIARADGGAGVVLLADLGSAVMTAEMALEFLEEDQREKIRLADAPLVEGAVAAAVAAQTGQDLAAVVRDAEAAAASMAGAAAESGAAPADAAPELDDIDQDDTGVLEASWELINPMGLHARPAAVVAQAMADLDADITINGVDGKSVMMLMTLGLKAGDTLTVSAHGPDAERAVEMLGLEVRNGFGEI